MTSSRTESSPTVCTRILGRLCCKFSRQLCCCGVLRYSYFATSFVGKYGSAIKHSFANLQGYRGQGLFRRLVDTSESQPCFPPMQVRFKACHMILCPRALSTDQANPDSMACLAARTSLPLYLALVVIVYCSLVCISVQGGNARHAYHAWRVQARKKQRNPQWLTSFEPSRWVINCLCLK